MKQGVFFLGLLSVAVTQAQEATGPSLTIDRIMEGEAFVGSLPEEISWSDNSEAIYFSWNPDQDTLRSTYRAEIGSREISRLSFEALRELPGEGEYNRDYSAKVYEKEGDLFLMDLSDYSVQRITNTLQRESGPRFSGDGQSVVYRQDDNLFQWKLNDGSTTQLTRFTSGGNQEHKKDPQDLWLEQEQLELFEVLQERKQKEDAGKYRREQSRFRRPVEIELGSKNLGRMTISPDLRYVIYQLILRAEDENTMVPDYVTRSGYTTELRSRPKVGSPQNRYETWILDLQADSTHRIGTSEIPGIYDKPAFLRDYASDTATYEEQYNEPKEVEIGMPAFSDEGKALVNITSTDHKDRWIMMLELSTGVLRPIDHQHDEAWIGGPGIGWMSRPEMGWIDEETVWFKSEKTGYAHLYSANIRSGKTRALTGGDFEILSATLSRDKGTFYLVSNRESPFEHQFYHLPSTGGRMVQITYMKGGHEVTVSPDEQWLAIRYSYSNQPWELYVMANEKGGEMEQLTESTSEAFRAYPWRDPEIVYFQARDGIEVPASLYRPAPENRNGAAVIFVHGAGYRQNVHHWWPGYYREYMFHNFLADEGYTVLAIDYRASAGYGRDWRTAIYRHMGGKDLEDQVDGARFLVGKYGIDRERIGIYGGSYGGFMTLMAMFKAPGTFRSGAALRSVTDWAHYNQGYTSAILNTPVADSLAYARSSPLYFAEGLQGQLLMLHGMVDTNVHFQDIVRLSQRLIELKKENWELAVFPVEDHGFQEASSWSDEYRRIFKLFETTLTEPYDHK
ncbi:MAG: alpha/beta fold hydrolase [Bacteroidales bacterium]